MAASTKTFAFPKARRLLKRREFLAVQDKGCKLFSRLFTVYFFLQPSEGESKVGITVSKKISKHANKRNLIRRRIREIFRIHVLPNLQQNIKVVVIARNSVMEAGFSDYKRDLLGLLGKKKLLLLPENEADS